MHMIHIMDAKEEVSHFQAVEGMEQSVKFVTCCGKYNIGSDLEAETNVKQSHENGNLTILHQWSYYLTGIIN